MNGCVRTLGGVLGMFLRPLTAGWSPRDGVSARTVQSGTSQRRSGAVVARPQARSPSHSTMPHPIPTTRRETKVPLVQPISELDGVSTTTTEPGEPGVL